jgi:hypothetical protein
MILTFAGFYRTMNSASKFGKQNDLEWFLILSIFPVFLLALFRDAGSGGFIILAGYFAGLLSSEIVFFRRKRRGSP